MYFDRLLEEVRRRGFQPRGAAPTEIAALERLLGHPLPAAYREFLAQFGNDHDGIWAGSDCFISYVPQNLRAAALLLRDNELDPSVLDGSVVWFTHQGYIASWFHPSSAADDPIVFLFNEATSHLGIHSPGTLTQLVCSDAAGLLGIDFEH